MHSQIDFSPEQCKNSGESPLFSQIHRLFFSNSPQFIIDKYSPIFKSSTPLQCTANFLWLCPCNWLYHWQVPFNKLWLEIWQCQSVEFHPEAAHSDSSSNAAPEVKVYNGYEGITQRIETNFYLSLFLEGEDVINFYPEILMIFSNNNSILCFKSTRIFFSH